MYDIFQNDYGNLGEAGIYLFTNGTVNNDIDEDSNLVLGLQTNAEIRNKKAQEKLIV